MTTIFRLPDRFGGEEAEMLQGRLPETIVPVRLAGGAIIGIDRGLLTLVGPPEPSDGTALIDASHADRTIWQRHDGTVVSGRHWWRMGDNEGHNWAFVLERTAGRPLLPLVPDPMWNLPDLPFKHDGCVEVQYNGPGDLDPVWIDIPSSFRTVDAAEEIGLAVLHAVRKAREARALTDETVVTR